MDGSYGHKADLFTNVSLMSAVGGIADIILLIFPRFELPVSAEAASKETSDGQFAGTAKVCRIF